MRKPSVAERRSFVRVVATAACVLLAAACALVGIPAGAAASATSGGVVRAAAAPRAPVFAYYYLWWSRGHWVDMLGPNYPTNSNPLPLPAKLDASGCGPNSRYAGNHLTDVPARLYSQDDVGFLESDVRQAAAAGLTGFIVNWAGSGRADQTTADSVYSRRLRTMVDAVHRVNKEGIPFKLWLSYKASASLLPTASILGDLSYFVSTYGRDSAFDHATSAKPTVIWQGSRKYGVSVLQAVSSRYRGAAVRLLGDESSWSSSRGRFLDGDAYYWSSQNPWSNPQSFQKLAKLAAAVRASQRNPDGSAKVWVAPAAPGYNSKLAGGSTCVPRRGGDTLRRLFRGNAATAPDAWGVISWNEIAEGTYIDPMTRYGAADMNALTGVIVGGA